MEATTKIISHRAIQAGMRRQALRPGLESTALPDVEDRVRQSIRSALRIPGLALEQAAPGQEAELFALLSDALSVLEAEERDRGVLTAVPHETASLLQSYLAERAEEAGAAAEPVPGGGVPHEKWTRG